MPSHRPTHAEPTTTSETAPAEAELAAGSPGLSLAQAIGPQDEHAIEKLVMIMQRCPAEHDAIARWLHQTWGMSVAHSVERELARAHTPGLGERAANVALAALGISDAEAGVAVMGPSADDDRFRLDDGQRPEVRMDHGFLDDGHGHIDPGRKTPATLADYGAFAYWNAKLLGAELMRPDLKQAEAAYRHFLWGRGAPREIGYEQFIATDPAGQRVLRSAIRDTQFAALHHGHALAAQDATYQIRTDPIAVGDRDDRYPYPSTEDWAKTIGAHTIWIEADVRTQTSKERRIRTFHVAMTLHAIDRYNFNPKGKDLATNTPDADNGRFETAGLAHEYDDHATIRREFSFDAPLEADPEFFAEFEHGYGDPQMTDGTWLPPEGRPPPPKRAPGESVLSGRDADAAAPEDTRTSGSGPRVSARE